MAGEYDFRASIANDTPESQLRTQIVRTLVSGKGIDPTDVFDKIAKRYDESPPRFHGLLVKFLFRTPKLDSSVLDRVRALLKHKDADVRAAALTALVERDPAGTAPALVAAMADPDPIVVARALEILSSQEQFRQSKEQGGDVEVPAVEFPVDTFLSLLLRSSPQPRNQRQGDTAFSVLRRLSSETSSKLIPRLTEILNDSARSADHLTVVRALGAMGDKAAVATPDLERVFNETQDMRLQVATAYALDQIGQNVGGGLRYRSEIMRFPQQASDNREEQERQKKREELERLLQLEQRLMR